MSAAQGESSLGKCVLVYLCMLAIAAIELVIAYHPPSGGQRLASSMLVLAFIGAFLGVAVFMRLGSERHALIIAFAVFTLFVLVAIQYGWTDSFRLLHGVPFAQ